jgi:hypothetical protein
MPCFGQADDWQATATYSQSVDGWSHRERSELKTARVPNEHFRLDVLWSERSLDQ